MSDAPGGMPGCMPGTMGSGSSAVGTPLSNSMGPIAGANLPPKRVIPPPVRSRTMLDERALNGPGSQAFLERVNTEGEIWGPPKGFDDLQKPRAPGLYSQQNHSSPALAFESHPNRSVTNSNTFDLPPLPSLDDINLGLENMKFDQTGERSNAYSALGNGFDHQPGPDGAMEIKGRQGNTTSIYSVDSGFSQGSSTQPKPQDYQVDRPNSQTSLAQTYGLPDGYSDERSPSVGGSTILPYDSASQYGAAYPDGGAGFYPDNQLGPPQQMYGYPQGQHSFADGSHQLQFQPHPSHGTWGYDYNAASQNPYYAAATQLGFSGDPNAQPQHPMGPYGYNQTLSRAPSALSFGNPNGMASRVGSSSDISRRGNPPSTGTKVTGPPITKASVDEYRTRIKADPDPEAQFNFAKYLIEAAKKISSSASGDEKSAKKYRDALLAESVKLIKRLATHGSGAGKPAYADAQFFLANCLGNGSLGLQVDHEKAYNLYVQASKQNHSAATYRTAVCNEVGAGTRKDHARAVLFYRKASALGDTAGMYKLGMILLNGLLGQQKNVKEAINWLKRAASQADEENPHALHELGLLYENAPPAPPPGNPQPLLALDPIYARKLFTQAAQLGYPPSQFKLGTIFEYGSLSCPVDPRRSIAWYTRAAERGDAESELALSGWYLTGSEGILKQSDSEAYLWARRAANKGLAKAEYAVGYYSEVGIGVKQDPEEARRWYMRAAAQGNKRAMTRLSEMRELSKGGKAKAKETRKR